MQQPSGSGKALRLRTLAGARWTKEDNEHASG